MKEIDLKEYIEDLFERVFRRIEHGDEEHRLWLKVELEKIKDEEIKNSCNK